MKRICATRTLKNAKIIRKTAPDVIPAKEPIEGFKHLVPLDVLRRFHRMPETELGKFPKLLKVKQALHPPPVKHPQSAALFGDPPFKGTLHFVRLTFFTEANHSSISVPHADVATALQYATLAIRPISVYSAQYGSNRLAVSPNIIEFGIAVTSGIYNDDAVQNMVNTILDQNHLDHDSSCIILLNPQGMINTDADPADGVGGYHDKANSTYCFVNVFGTGLTIADKQDFYADTLSHEIAEMTCDPDVSFFNDEVCDGCAGNCNNSWRNFFVDPSPSLANSYLGSSKTFPPPFPFTYFIASIATRAHADDCPASQAACAYGPPIRVGRSELLFYERIGGVGEFYSVDGQADIGIQLNHSDWRKTWSLVIPGNFASKLNANGSSLLFYSPSEGTGEFYKNDGSGHISLVGGSHTDWNKTWTHIVPGKFSNGSFDDLLFYDRGAGLGQFWHSDGGGNISRIGTPHTDWRKSWSLIIPGKFSDGAYTDLLFYDPGASTGEFWRTDGKGGATLIGANHNWRADWSIIIPGKFSDGKYTDLLFYEPSTGTGEFWRTDGRGNVSLIGGNYNWRTDWSIIIPGNFSGGKYTDLLFYEPSTGTGEFWRTDGHGNVSLIKSYTNWRRSWAAILQP